MCLSGRPQIAEVPLILLTFTLKILLSKWYANTNYAYYEVTFLGDTDTDTNTDTDTDTGDSSENTEEVEFQLTLRDYLIQFVNEYFAEEFTPEVSTDMLHNRLLQFFDENR